MTAPVSRGRHSSLAGAIYFVDGIVSRERHAAAEDDGADVWQEFWRPQPGHAMADSTKRVRSRSG